MKLRLFDHLRKSALPLLADSFTNTRFLPTAQATVAGALAEPAHRVGFWERLDRWAWKAVVKEREAYLSQAQNMADLENRIRALDSWRGRYY